MIKKIIEISISLNCNPDMTTVVVLMTVTPPYLNTVYQRTSSSVHGAP